MQGVGETHEQVIRLHGTNAARTAALGAFVIGMAGLIVALVSGEPWPIRMANGLVVVPVALSGLIIVGLAGLFHLRKAVWRLRADGSGVSLSMDTASGRPLKHEAVRIDDVIEMVWIEGDDDVSPGVRLRSHRGPGLFVPANSFDVKALWAFSHGRRSPRQRAWRRRAGPWRRPTGRGDRAVASARRCLCDGECSRAVGVSTVRRAASCRPDRLARAQECWRPARA